MHHNKNINCQVEIDTPGHIPSTAGDSGIRSWGCRVPLYTLAYGDKILLTHIQDFAYHITHACDFPYHLIVQELSGFILYIVVHQSPPTSCRCKVDSLWI